MGVDAEPVREFPGDSEIHAALSIVFNGFPMINLPGSGANLRHTVGWTALESICKAHAKPLREIFSEPGNAWLRRVLHEPRHITLYFQNIGLNIVTSICIGAKTARLQQRSLC